MKVDMHVHSWWSRDAVSRPDQILDQIEKKGIDGVVVTDHDAAMILEEISTRKIIPGIEFSTDLGHLLGFWFYEKYRSGNRVKFEEAVKLIRDSGGLVFLAHPFDGHRSFRVEQRVVSLIDGVEVCNGKNKSDDANRAARQFAKWHKLLVSAGSDAHFPGEIGRAYVEASSKTLEGFRKRFERGDVVVHCGRQNLVSQLLSFSKSKFQQYTNYAGRPGSYSKI